MIYYYLDNYVKWTGRWLKFLPDTRTYDRVNESSFGLPIMVNEYEKQRCRHRQFASRTFLERSLTSRPRVSHSDRQPASDLRIHSTAVRRRQNGHSVILYIVLRQVTKCKNAGGYSDNLERLFSLRTPVGNCLHVLRACGDVQRYYVMMIRIADRLAWRAWWKGDR